MSQEFQKMIDNSAAAEQSVIGSLMINNSCWDEIGDLLKEEDFYNFGHKVLYKIISTLAANNKPFDIITITDLLKQTGELEIVGGELYLFELARNTPTAANVKAYAEIVKRKAIDRRMIDVAHKIIASVSNQDENRLDNAQMMIEAIADQTPQEIIRRGDLMPDMISVIDDRRARGNNLLGISTGFEAIDGMTAGLQQGDIIVLGARPSMGKTALALNIADHVSLIQRKSVIVFSQEMRKEKLLDRTLSSMAKVEMQRLKTGVISPDDTQRILNLMPRFENDKLIIDDRSSVSVQDIRSKCRKVKREIGLDLIVIDYIGLMSGDGENETLRIGNISRGLKLIARDLDVPLIIISQLNRGVENRQDKRPTMSDLRQSGAIEQDADIIMLLYRDEVYDKENAERGKAEVIVAKNRDGEIGTVNLTFNGKYACFEDYKEQSRYCIVEKSPKSMWAGMPDY